MEREIIVPENTNLIINDTQIDTGLISRAAKRLKWCSADLIVLDRKELTTPLAESLERRLQNKDVSLGIIFPGQGAQQVKEVLPISLIRDMKGAGIIYDTQTSRVYERNLPSTLNADIPRDLAEKINNRKITNIWIIDDVIATGQTIQGMRSDIIRQLVEMQPEDENYNQSVQFSFPRIKVPNTTFSAYTWLKQKSAKIENFDVFASIIYFRKSSKVSLTSLSTLLGNSEKSNEVRKVYSAKYFNDYREFNRFIDQLKKLL